MYVFAIRCFLTIPIIFCNAYNGRGTVDIFFRPKSLLLWTKNKRTHIVQGFNASLFKLSSFLSLISVFCKVSIGEKVLIGFSGWKHRWAERHSGCFRWVEMAMLLHTRVNL